LVKQSKLLLQLFLKLIKQRIKIWYLLFIYKLPWPNAISLAAWVKYKESPLFRNRWIEFSREMAAKLYTYEEHKYFIELVKRDKQLMNKIIFRPYSILSDISEDDFRLRQEVKF
jgi:hypothetical protein